ncbi:MAG: molybdopterin molybdotransferase MoeA [Gammaproteobacteria bacterium]|nr:molybdopterin molybdotransferase MoeA [Gammaproteobacteria bacterium]MDE1887717.1 molybdopterin molybdotransferase MoeA [Gammaproteobacteria bacterium]MDE2023001.1 molybdopterin molybdotransferase MoeA [Gammaproteobacteria bacterium]MDE2138965.1 molybdopterin molybdotransferase MoeA [Gammaproteobacteria bacterium]MDE2273156.1 molybdopterin molybdotransferase MoeA [Gammaproteobacteria bacterium]
MQTDTTTKLALSVEQARERILSGLRPVDAVEKVTLSAAAGRILAEDLIARLPVPAFANSAMDGYALAGRDLPVNGERRLRVIGSSLAGHPFMDTVGTVACVRIMTGAMLPSGTDTVVMQEEVRTAGADIVIRAGHRIGENVRLPGSDVPTGSRVLEHGRRLRPGDLGVIASLGLPEVNVRRRVRIAFFSTGDELREPGVKLAPGQIYERNRYTLSATLASLGADFVDLGVVPDQPEAIRAAMKSASQADIVLTSGGVSVGDTDYVRQVLAELGEISFWRVAMKPGKPLAFGRLGNAWFFGLPGNPVSALVTFQLFVAPALHVLAGESYREPFTLRAQTLCAFDKRQGRAEFPRGILSRKDGAWFVGSAGSQDSSALSVMSRANCFVLLPAEAATIPAGMEIEVMPFDVPV